MNNQLATISKSLAKKYQLEEWHIELLNIVMLPKAFRPNKWQIMARLEITERVYYYWIRHPKFNDARREFVKQYFKDDIPDILMALKDEAIAGNPVAAKLFLEYVDDFNNEPGNKLLDQPPPIPKGEIKIIINQLTNKFYGNEKPTIRDVENETKLEVRGGVVLDERGLESLPIEMGRDLGDQDPQS